MQYEINGCFKSIEEDIFAEGCQPHSGRVALVEVRLRADTVEGLLKKFNNFLGNDDWSAIELDACDEPGRVDVSILENDEGEPATEWQIEAWKNGKQRLWAATYTAHIEAVERRPVELRAIVWAEAHA